MLRRLMPDPFVLTLLATLGLATLLPVQGVGAELVSWLATGAIVLLFFFHGAKLSRQAVISGLTHWRLHIVILLSTFVMFPVVGLALANLLPDLLPAPLWIGVLYMVALPSTVQSSIAFTSIARGNVPAAITAASASQVLGVLVTPVLVGFLAEAQGGEVAVAGIGKIMLLVLVPFITGHLLRPWIGVWVQRYKATIGITDRATILIAVYSAFSAAVVDGIWGRLPLPVLATLFGVCALVLMLALLFTRFISRRLGFKTEDEIAIVFCGTKKSLIQGVPMARVLFAGPDLGLILLPIMIFHQLQLMVCSSIARRYAKRSDKDE